MTRTRFFRGTLIVALMLLALAAAAADRTASRRATSTAATRKPEAAKAATPVAGTKSAASTAPRTLDPVHIEGELDVPEVLFITARDQRRIVDFQHRRYLPTAAARLGATPLPTRIVVDHGPAPLATEAPR